MRLVCDITSVCKSFLSKSNIEYLHKLVDKENDEKLNSFVSEILSNKMSFDSDHYSNIPFEEIKEGDILIADVSDTMALNCIWRYIHIDHIYRDVVFYTVLDDGVEEKEGFFQKGSLFYNKKIYPCYIVKQKDYTITCSCPLVNFVDSLDEISENYRIYRYKSREEEDYI